jgi:dTMP kinase
MKRGLFFAFEGIDGCGKSTQVKAVRDKLVDSGHDVVVTREPGGTVISEKIREILIDPAHAEMVNECELLLYLAARAQHVKEKIIPALEQGMIVLCDRFQLATLAYQGYGRNFNLELLEKLNSFATAGLVPDMTFVFDIPVELAFERMRKMDKLKDRLESSGADFFRRIRKGYIELGSRDKMQVTIINADRPIFDINVEVMGKIIEICAE